MNINAYNKSNEVLKLNFEYFITMATQDKISWDTLIVFLEDLTPTLDKSKQANIVLVKELQKMHQKLQEKGADDDIDIIEIKPVENSERCNEKLPRNQIEEEIASESVLIQQGKSKDQPSEFEIIQFELDEGPEQETQSSEDIENPDLQIDQQLSLQINGEECLSQIEDLAHPLDAHKQIDEVTKAKEDPKQIIKSRTTKKEYNCKICNEVFSTLRALKLHAEAHPDKSILKSGIKCGTCKKRFKRFNDMKFHEAIHTRGESEQTDKCYMCDKTFKSSLSLRKHEYYHHSSSNEDNSSQNDYGCKSCSMKFNDKNSLLKHERIRHTERPFQCHLCNKTFTLKDRLHSHVNRHSNRFRCTTCSKCFATNYHLQRHNRIHTGEKPFRCSTCQKEFRWHSDYTEHVRIHTGEKPYSCINCNERFKSLKDLKNHVKIH